MDDLASLGRLSGGIQHDGDVSNVCGRETRSVNDTKDQVNEVINLVVISLLVTLREGVLVRIVVEAISLTNVQGGDGLVLGSEDTLISEAFNALI